MEKEIYVINKKELMKALQKGLFDAEYYGAEGGAWSVLSEIANLLNEDEEFFLKKLD